MRIFPPTLEIGEHEGFGPEKDLFQRAEFGRGIGNLLSSSSDPLVIALDAPWGSGKTTFIRMLAGHLRNEGFPVIYFDAFENDHLDDGFIAIAGEVIRVARELEKTQTESYKKFVSKAARAGSVLLRTGTKVGVKALTLGALDAANLEELKSVASDIAKETSTKADEYVGELLKLQSQEHKTIHDVREALAELASNLGTKEATDQTEGKPLIFIIDELDRCRPTFALELLEKIKHIFSTPKVHFFLSTHIGQLESSIRVTYGPDVDARTYLQKFYNIILHFPESGTHTSERVIPRYFKYLSKTMSVAEDDLKPIKIVSEARQLSLRAIEKIVSCFAIARHFTPSNYLWLKPIVAGLSVIKIIEPALFQKCLKANASVEDIKLALRPEDWEDEDSYREWALGWWIYCLAKEEKDFPDIEWNKYHTHFFKYSIRSRRDIVPLLASYIDNFQAPPS